jgi:hypothetical protein
LKRPVLPQVVVLNGSRPLNRKGWFSPYIKQISHFYRLGNSPELFSGHVIVALTWKGSVLIMMKTGRVQYIQPGNVIGEEPDCEEVFEAV